MSFWWTEGPRAVRCAATDRTIQWRAQTRLSRSGALTVNAAAALRSDVVQRQLGAIRALRERLRAS